MRRPIAAVVFLLASAPAALLGCVGSAPREPTLPTVDFRPKLVIEVDDASMRFVRGPREDPSVTTDPPAVRGGTVVEVVNSGRRDHRVQAGTTFDTGHLRPGERTVVVLENDTPDDKVIDIVSVGEDERATLVVRPRGS